MSPIRLRNNPVRLGIAALGMASVLTMGPPAWAQINVDELNPANIYDTGGLQPGMDGLGSDLWQGTTSPRATRLINAADINANGTARYLIRTALLSGGVPPRTDDNLEREAYTKARFSAVLGFRDLAAFDQLLNHAGIGQNNPTFSKIFVERALLGGDILAACALSDAHIIERKAPYWAKLRAFCHVVRGEIPAAELTADLLSRSNHVDKPFFDMLGKLTGSRPNIKISTVTAPLQIAMLDEIRKTDGLDVKNLPGILSARTALGTQQPPDDRLAALLASVHILSAEQVRNILGALAASPLESLDNIDHTKAWNAQKWGQVYLALGSSNDMNYSAQLVTLLLEQADKGGVLLPISRALEPQISSIPADILAKHNAGVYARLAVDKRDTIMLRSLFLALKDDDPLRARIALASDALGGGFLHGDLGVDIETRLTNKSTRERAVRDSYIAVALGANLSDMAIGVLSNAKLKGAVVDPGDLLSLQAAARRGAKAELALRTAKVFGAIPPGEMRADGFAAILSAMTSAGMNDMAGRLAAQDLLNYD